MEELVQTLIKMRSVHTFPLRVRSKARDFAKSILAVLFPHFSDTLRCDTDEVAAEVSFIKAQLTGLMSSIGDLHPTPPKETADEFLAKLPLLYETLIQDARAIYRGDPAAPSEDEVILAYPGFYAIAIFRIAHVLYELGYPLLPRLLTEHAHERTGIDIHPGATIGRSFFIDHGTGVVIGESAWIGNGVKIYQGVTLGALSVEKANANMKRHPTLEDNVVVYANATILGGETVIGNDSVVGGNAWVTSSVPPFSSVGRLSEVRARTNREDSTVEFHI